MSFIISAYSHDSFKEYNLPSLNNSDYELVIKKSHLNLQTDLRVLMEIVDNQWTMKDRQGYSLFVGEQRYDTVDLSDGLILNIVTHSGDTITMIASEAASPFHAFEKFRISGGNEISFGRDASNDVVFNFKGIGRKHAVITRNGRDAYITNYSLNGIYINSRRVDGTTALSFGDYINIIGLHMVYLGSMLAIDTAKTEVTIASAKLKKVTRTAKKSGRPAGGRELSTGKILYRRAPRYVEGTDVSEIEIEAPPPLPEEKSQSLFMAVGPSLTMALPMLLGCSLMIYASRSTQTIGSSGGFNPFMLTGLVMAVSSAFVGVIWTLANRRQQRNEREKFKELRLNKYSEYLIEKANEVKEAYDQTINSLYENYPDASKCISYDEHSGELWNRNASHPDFLVHRLGTGDTPFSMDIKIPPQKFSLYEDDLAQRPDMIKSNYATLYDVPVTIDMFEHRIIGIVGGEGRGNAVDIARNLSAQIAANNCYTDVKLAYIYDKSSTYGDTDWDFAKWLPHVWSEDHKTRFIASDADETADILYELGNVFRIRSENEEEQRKQKFPKPYYILFVSDASLIEGELFSKYIFDEEQNLGLTTVILAEQYEELPNRCEFIIEDTERFRGYYQTSMGSEAEQRIKFDNVDPAGFEAFARRISKLQVMEIESGGDIPNSLTFFEMMGIKKPEDLPVKDLWTKNRIYDNIKGLLGQKAGGAPLYLDVHEKFHGPHGLVAGTTGSGKSETLQTYILSLAVNYSPDDVAFFIIDYKGGGMANLFDGLPHMAGQISNLSGNQVKRAMISIKSENRRRQRIFSDYGVNNINSYTKMYKSGEATVPVPHLFIIIDEFAELKREEPEFMRELISVAQVGRSLGVHLILATQKPSGTVDDNIWSNSRFRLCLRVQDKQDSNDMLHKPDAAYITQAGRCYLQVGNDELYELFQSGYSGAVYDADSYTGGTDVAKLIALTGKTDLTGNTIRQKQKKRAEIAWTETLLGILKESAARVLASNDGGMNDSENAKQIVSRMYALMAARGIDFGESKFNTSRLLDLISMYAELNDDGTEPGAEEILQLAQQSGRKLPQQKEHTELDAVRDHLAKVSSEAGYVTDHRLWLPVLREKIYLDEFEEFRAASFSKNGTWKPADRKLSLNVVIGQMDDPENQNQMPFTYDFAEEGNLAVCGSIVSGKSTSLQTIAYSLIQNYSPEAVSIYALDFSSKMMSAFEHAPHVGGVMYENDDDKIAKFFNMINGVLEERKKVFHGGNYKQYVRVNGIVMPAIFIMIDNYGAFKQKTGEAYEEDVMKLAKEGISNGIYMVVSGGGFSANEITTRIGGNFQTVLTLALKDKFEYGDLLHSMQISVMPEQGVKGRGLAYYGNRILEYQTAAAVEADNDYERMERIKEVCAAMAGAWTGRRARPVPVIPEKPLWKEFSELDEYKEKNSQRGLLPVGYDQANASVYGIPLKDIFCYGIYGEMKTGKTNMLKACILSAADKQAEVYVIDAQERPLAMFDGYEGVSYLTEDKEVFDAFNGLIPEFKKRRDRKTELIKQGKESDEIFEVMSSEFRPVFIFISELDQFVNMIYKSEYNMKGFLENVIGKGQGNNIYFFADLSLKNKANAGGYPVFDTFIGYRKGIHLGGRTTMNMILNFDYITSYSEKNKTEKAGMGTLPDVIGENETSKVVIPLVRMENKEESDK
ncbi:MAG: type VII secretion protein EssC [Clostridiales bacterium]|nr:type VII secretion protein EssC [Clostridiales bacterium]